METSDEPEATPADGGPGFGAPPTLSPAQLRTLELLGAPRHERPRFAAGLGEELFEGLQAGLAPLLDELPAEDRLWISKYPLGRVHGCEARFVAEHGTPFAWSPPAARGTVAHKAIELGIHWKGEHTPLDLVDEAMASLESGTSGLADWLQGCSRAQRAELRAEANERVAKFLECFPPMRKQWRPVTESKVSVELFGERIVLQGRVDLTLGHAEGGTANKVLIDLKSGGFSPTHVDDLRFYALLETIRLGTPPRLLATYYLDSGRPHPEAVTDDLLHAALQRTVDGAARMVALVHGAAPPVKRPGRTCRWCPLLDDCTEGRAFLADDAFADDPVAEDD